MTFHVLAPSSAKFLCVFEIFCLFLPEILDISVQVQDKQRKTNNSAKHVLAKQDGTGGEIKLNKSLAASVRASPLHLERWSPHFRQMLALQKQGNNSTISFTNWYPNMTLNPTSPTKVKKRILPKNNNSLSLHPPLLCSFLFSLAYFHQAACLTRKNIHIGYTWLLAAIRWLSFDGDTFTSLTLKYPALVYHLEIIAMVTRHLSVNRDLWSAGRLGLEAQVIVGFTL